MDAKKEESLRVVHFSTPGELKRWGAFHLLESSERVEAGDKALNLSRPKEHYTFEGKPFCLIAGEGSLELEECLNAPKVEDITPYFSPIFDRERRLLPCPNFEKNLDAYLMRRDLRLFDRQEVKGFEVFLKTMDTNTQSGIKKFVIPECESLNRFLAQKVRKHKQKRGAK